MPMRRMVLLFPLVVFFTISGFASRPSRAEDNPSKASIVSALQQVPVFARLDNSQLRKLSKAVEVSRLQKGDKIIEQGKRTGRLLVVLDSEVQVRIGGALVVVLPANALVGEIEFLADVPASADVVLNGNSRVIAIAHKALRDVMDGDPRIGYILMDAIARMEANRLRMNDQRLQK